MSRSSTQGTITSGLSDLLPWRKLYRAFPADPSCWMPSYVWPDADEAPDFAALQSAQELELDRNSNPVQDVVALPAPGSTPLLGSTGYLAPIHPLR